MHLPPFEYLAPSSLSEALEILAERGEEVLPLAGGTDILVMLKEGKLKPAGLVSLKDVRELREIKFGNGTCEVGAASTVTEIERSELPTSTPAIGDLIKVMANRQIRNRASVGGNICTASACADFPPVLMVCGASILLKSKDAEREMPLVDFFKGPRLTSIKSDELLVSIRLKTKNPGSAYVKFGVRNAANITIVGVACSLSVADGVVSDITLASTAASPTPIVVSEAREALVGEPPTEETWKKAAGLVRSALSPIADIRGSHGYRLHLARIGTVRALKMAYERLKEAGNA